MRASRSVLRPVTEETYRPDPSTRTVTASAIQFQPDGTAQLVGATGTGTTLAAPTTVTVTRRNVSKTISVNGAGKVQLNVQ